ncbi:MULTISPECIES: S1 RNA-binding domain-containing protein [unclassified Streptomyces]|uniref:S1 RNA-binding domain-containing protein n=1 Tax=unclassified Streptomyces TaxID=2593676 RepID=UPI0037FE18CF
MTTRLPFGVFVRVAEHVEGLVPAAEAFAADAAVGDEVLVVVADVDLPRRRLTLSPSPRPVPAGAAPAPGGGPAAGR